MATKELSPKQHRFVEEFVIDFNGTQAAIRAGYSEKGASVQASNLLANPKVKGAVREKQQEITDTSHITVDRVLLELASMAFDKSVPQHLWHNRTKPLELIGKHLGMFVDRTHLTNDNGPKTFAELMEELDGKAEPAAGDHADDDASDTK